MGATLVGCSRAVRVGPFISVAGTTPGHPTAGRSAEKTSASRPARLRRLQNALQQAGAELKHVVRTRMYVTDISRRQEVAQAHGEVFGSIWPATSMLEVNRLIEPALLVGIEADAIVP